MCLQAVENHRGTTLGEIHSKTRGLHGCYPSLGGGFLGVETGNKRVLRDCKTVTYARLEEGAGPRNLRDRGAGLVQE